MPYTPPPGYYPQYYQPQGYMDQLAQLKAAQQPYTPQIMPPQVNANTGSTPILWVQGEAGAKSWYITPGSTVLLMDSESQRFYLKSADMNGVPAMRTFEYVEAGTQKPQEAPQAANFVTVDAFNEFRDDVLKRLEDLSEPVEVSVSRKGRKGNIDE